MAGWMVSQSWLRPPNRTSNQIFTVMANSRAALGQHLVSTQRFGQRPKKMQRLFSSLMTLSSDEMKMRLERLSSHRNTSSHTRFHTEWVLEERKDPERPGHWQVWQNFCKKKKWGKFSNRCSWPDASHYWAEIKTQEEEKNSKNWWWFSCGRSFTETFFYFSFCTEQVLIMCTCLFHWHTSPEVTLVCKRSFGGTFYSCGSREQRWSLQSFLFSYVEIIMESPA